jgi:Schlafen, AlbA_2/Eco57I restriction-modification methylase
LFKLFGSFSWNLNDKPGGQDNEINPDVLGYIVEKYINQKAFGAYYTRPEITGYLCERTIHRLILDAVNTPEQIIDGVKKTGLPVRSFKNVDDLLKKLDPALATKLLEDVLPKLALLDPACGSGAFLVAAMKTLIDIYAAVFGWIKFNGSPALKARVKNIEADHASLDYFIKKRIISDNLFGVDIMEEAVEIARLRLFLALAASANTVEELEPLPNIDFNILRGNSLIGLMHVDAKGFSQKNLFLPPYEQVLRDRERQLHLYRNAAEYLDDLTPLRDKIADVNAQAQDTLDQILLDDFQELGIKYEQATWDDKKGAEGKPQKRPLKLEDIQALHPFHWAFAFDKVMARGGFDAIITNPPWEVLKPYAKEFFQSHSELVTKLFMPIEDFEKEKSKLLKDATIRTAWLEYSSGYAHQSAWLRSAQQYEKQISIVKGKKAGTDVNLYKLFVEQCFNLLRAGGRCGILTPGSLYNDLGAKRLREMLFEEGQVDSLFGLANERFMFEGLDHRFKVCILSFAKGGKTTQFPAAFRIQPREAVWPDELDEFFHNPEEHLFLSVEVIRKLSPDSLSLMEFKNKRDLAIAEKLARFPMLGEQRDDWWSVRFHREFDMTNDSDLFKTTDSKNRLPLFEGKMIHHFNHQFASPKYWIDECEARVRLLGRETDQKQRLDYQSYRLGFRDVARNSDERTCIITMLPASVFCNHKIPTALARTNKQEIAPWYLLFFCGCMNSFLVDFLVRQRVTTNLTFITLYQLPMPRVGESEDSFENIAKRVARLICTTPEFDDLAKEVGLKSHKQGVTNPIERAKLRAEIDAMVAHLYRLTEDEFAHILATFPLVAEETKQAALDEFIRMRESGEAAVFNPDLAKPAAAVVDPAKAVKDLIAAGESAVVEFKSTARWDVKNSKPEKFIERIIVKTVAAFLNTAGGTLVIGLEDDENVYGLAEDYKLCGDKGRDGFELWLTQTLLKDFGKDAAASLSVAFYELKPPEADKPGSGDVCVVTVQPSPKPRFFVEDGKERFYIRTGNATNELKPSELLDYCKERWP